MMPAPDKPIVLADSNTVRLLPQLSLDREERIVIPAGDENKTLQTLSFVWDCLQALHATRHTLLYNVGGGMVCDLGGMAASTYMRGMRFINIPTSLLAMVDASAGGKVGINYGGVKNLIGVFNEPLKVEIKTELLRDLDMRNMLSGYAEMIKHGLIGGEELLNKTLSYDIEKRDLQELDELVRLNIELKGRVVREDFRESGRRKVLNLGHTFGHAIEAYLEGRELHGYCVAWGLVVAAYLSVIKMGFPQTELTRLAHIIKNIYGNLPIDCKAYERLYDLMQSDKKNEGSRINFTLLRRIGEPVINCDVTREEIFEAIDFMRYEYENCNNRIRKNGSCC